MQVTFIRHGSTQGNLEKRYIGKTTDEGLCEVGINQIRQMNYPKAELVFISPMKRCEETARLIYPDMSVIKNEKFMEIDFGAFEGKNYQELNGNADYQAWIDSNGTLAFPDGESRADFSKRCIEGFEECMQIARQNNCQCISLVVHGGTIMSILEQYGTPKGEYYHWQIENAKYITVRF